MKRLTPLKTVFYLSILLGLFITIITGGWMIVLGGYFMLFALLLFLADKATRRINKRIIYHSTQYFISISYLLFILFSYLDWNKHMLIIIPDNFEGEAGIIFGVENYPELPKMEYWEQKIHIPNNGVVVTSTLEDDIPNKLQFEFSNGEMIRGDRVNFSTTRDYQCLLSKSELKYFSFSIGMDSNSIFQNTLSSLCDSINQQKLTTKYKSEYSPIVESVEQPYLHLQDKNLSQLPTNINSLQVKKIILTNNKFTEFPEEIFDMPQLEELLIGHNPIEKLPDNLERLSQLKRLSINNTLIRDFPEDLSALKELESIGLDHNELVEVPEAILTLPKLKRLKLNDNKLSDVAFLDERLSELESIYLYSNSITQLNCQISYASNLKELLIYDNEIDSIPDCIGILKNLEVLQIWGNPIKYISPEIQQLTNLKTLRLDKQNLNEIQMQQLRDWLPNCKINFQ